MVPTDATLILILSHVWRVLMEIHTPQCWNNVENHVWCSAQFRLAEITCIPAVSEMFLQSFSQEFICIPCLLGWLLSLFSVTDIYFDIPLISKFRILTQKTNFYNILSSTKMDHNVYIVPTHHYASDHLSTVQ